MNISQFFLNSQDTNFQKQLSLAHQVLRTTHARSLLPYMRLVIYTLQNQAIFCSCPLISHTIHLPSLQNQYAIEGMGFTHLTTVHILWLVVSVPVHTLYSLFTRFPTSSFMLGQHAKLHTSASILEMPGYPT